jgi:dienelactone hydrolase
VTHTALATTAPFYDSRGWIQWPDSEDYSLEFMQVLGAAQDGGSTVSECFLAARGITPGDDESWYREWKRAADVNRARGDAAQCSGHTQTAVSNWLRAINYYRASHVFLATDDPRHAGSVADMQACSRLYLRAAGVGEPVEISWSENAVSQGYFLAAPGSAGRSSVVLCFGGPDHFKEEFLHSLPRHAHRRGLSLLLVDLPDQAGRAPAERRLGRYDIETAVSTWVDFLVGRDDVDPSAIAIFGDGLGASFATRAASLDDRFAAAVCDGGLWDLHERAFLTGRMSARSDSAKPHDFATLCATSIARSVRCPMLVTIGERDWLDAGRVTACCEVMRSSGLDIDLKVFTAAETAAGPSHLDNPTIGNEFIFDWIADRLRRK